MTLSRHIFTRTLAVAGATTLLALGVGAAAHAQEPDDSKTLTGVTSPQGVAVAQNGDVYVAGSSGTTVDVFDAGETTPNPAKQLTGLNRPRGVAFDSAGNVYVANTRDNNVLVFDPQGSHSTPARTLTGVSYPFGVAVNSQGVVYASVGLESTVAVFDPNTTTPNAAKTLTGLDGASGVAVDANDNVYVGNSPVGNRVTVFEDGQTVADPDRTMTGVSNPQGIAIDSTGRVYIASAGSSTVEVFNPNQTTPDPARQLTDLTVPLGIGISSGDTVYVGDSGIKIDTVKVYPPANPPAPPAFECTGEPQTYAVPDWTNSLNVTLRGAQGGGSSGGQGGAVSSRVSVDPGSTIQVNVGCEGKGSGTGVGGFNGGADAGAKKSSTGAHLGAFTGGGGATDLRIGDCATTGTCGVSARVLVAGGGGGAEARASKNFSGGSGGHATGGKGIKDYALGVGNPGRGGTATAGGAGGAAATLSGGSKGSSGTAGSGGTGGAAAPSSQSGPGAGGGGGLFGGGGGGSGDAVTGAGIGGAGGGGSSGVGPKGAPITSGVTYKAGSQAGDGSVDITPIPLPLTVSTKSLADGSASQAYSQQLSADGGVPGYTWEVTTGTLPNGLSLAPGGAITGTPTSNGTSDFTVQVTDQADKTANKALSITVDDGIVITTDSLADGSAGAAYSTELESADGGGAKDWQVTKGALPAGLSLDPDTGDIHGTPTVADTFNFTVEVTGNDDSTAVAPFTINVSDELTVTTTDLPNGVAGSAVSTGLSATGGIPPYEWSITDGNLPSGLSLAPTTGLITGTPASAGTYDFTVGVSDYLGTEASQPLSLTVNAPVEITTSSVPAGTATVAYSQALQASGGLQPYTWAVTVGALPAGLNLEQHTGVISGTPTTAGTTSFAVTVTDANSGESTAALSIQVKPAPIVTASVKLSGAPKQLVVNEPIKYTVTATPSTAPGKATPRSVNVSGTATVTANGKTVCRATITGGVGRCTGKVTKKGNASLVATFSGTVNGKAVSNQRSATTKVPTSSVSITDAKVVGKGKSAKLKVSGMDEVKKRTVTILRKSGKKWVTLGTAKSNSKKAWSFAKKVGTHHLTIKAKDSKGHTADVKLH